MHGDFCWRQSKDEPTVAYVDVRQLQGVAQKSAVSLRILAVDDRMRSRNHDCPRPKSVIVAAIRQITAAWQRGPAHCPQTDREAISLDRSYPLPQNTSDYATCPRHKRTVRP